MNEFDQAYLVPDGTDLQGIKDALEARCQIGEDEPRHLLRRFHDTFDWSLYLAGGVLEERIDGHQRFMLWRDLNDEVPALACELERDLGFAADLPPGPDTERLARLLGIRRLLPLLDVHSRILTWRLLNEDDKTIARLELEQNRYDDKARERQGPISTRLRLHAVKGYEADFRETARMLNEELGLSLVRTELLLEALASAGRKPGDYSSQLNFRLDPDRRADATTKEILLHLLNTIEVNLPGTRDNLDSEFLHDLRVAVRRTRSALTQIKDVFAPDLVEQYKDAFGWIGEFTGPVRDLDVYLLDFNAYQACLPEPLRPHLEPLRDFIHAHYGEEQKTLVGHLNSKRFRDLLRDWRAFLEAPVPESSVVPNAMRPVLAVADDRIWTMYRRVRKEGRAMSPTSPPEDMHELRKSCKKLRYLVEFFDSLYPKQEVRQLVKLFKVLLDNLGKFQDLAVQADHLREMAQRMRDEDRASTDTLLTMGILVGDLLEHQHRAREDFAQIFASFDSDEHQGLFKTLFDAQKRQGKGA
ncbi:MAG: CHAD domain-containing protein [Chromatiaceae bacterium]